MMHARGEARHSFAKDSQQRPEIHGSVAGLSAEAFDDQVAMAMRDSHQEFVRTEYVEAVDT